MALLEFTYFPTEIIKRVNFEIFFGDFLQQSILYNVYTLNRISCCNSGILQSQYNSNSNILSILDPFWVSYGLEISII